MWEGLAPDGGVSAKQMSTGPLLSGASPLPHLTSVVPGRLAAQVRLIKLKTAMSHLLGRP